MGRLPFDPSKMSPPPGGPAAPRDSAQPISVSRLAAMIDAGLKQTMPDALRVVGQVSGFRERTHWYFDLKDAQAVINCVMFQSAARRAGFVPANGQDVVVRGRIEFFAPGGKVSFVLDRVEPVGVGALELAYRKLVEEIRQLGWFSPERKRPLPAFPRRIAVITSRTGAALQDVLDTIRRRCPAVGVALIDVRVQGEGAAAEIARAIDWAGAQHAELGIDAVLVTRGGGSMEDLWAFNEKIVAAAIVRSPVPVVAAIGHETDTTIAELVADERAATPTQAAMRLTPDARALVDQIDSLDQRLGWAVSRLITDARRRTTDSARRGNAGASALLAARAHRLERLAVSLERNRPAAVQARLIVRLHEYRVRFREALRERLARPDLDRLAARLDSAIRSRLVDAGRLVAAHERHLEAVGPASVLRRGFSVTSRADGSIVRSASDVRTGEALVTRLADGSIPSVVTGAAGATPPLPPARPGRKPKPARTPGELDLFGGGG